MKKSSWMSESGHQSGERAERLHQQAVRSRSPVEVFASHFMVVAVGALLLGGSIGLLMLPNTLPPSLSEELGGPIFWVANRLTGLVVGLLSVALFIDVPMTMVMTWLRKSRPHLFKPRCASSEEVT